MAVQALYQMDIAQTDLSKILVEFTSVQLEETPAPTDAANDNNPADNKLFENIARGVVVAQREIDPHIQNHLADGWRLSRIDSTLRAILRAGSYELLVREDIPLKVVISEYVDIAHAFFDGDEPKVVNAVLDRIGRQARGALSNTESGGTSAVEATAPEELPSPDPTAENAAETGESDA